MLISLVKNNPEIKDQTQYVQNHIENDFKQFFADITIENLGRTAYFSNQQDKDNALSALENYKQHGLHIDDLLFKTVTEKFDGFIIG